jgi:hypothetical protein
VTVYVLRKIDRDARRISVSALQKDLRNGPVAVVSEFARACNPFAGCPIEAEEPIRKVESDRESIVRENAAMGNGESDELSKQGKPTFVEYQRGMRGWRQRTHRW